MQSKLATRDDAISFGKKMQARLPELSEQTSVGKSESGLPEYTRAIWEYFDKLRQEFSPLWTLYPKERPTGTGKAKGEFLIDFSLFDDDLGWRVACESEWGKEDKIGWAFDKLMHVKADLKILIFQWEHDPANTLLPPLIEKRLVHDALATDGHHHPGQECYLLIQFDHNNPRLFFWEPKRTGRHTPNEIKFEYIP